jgi:hypothetical protein
VDPRLPEPLELDGFPLIVIHNGDRAVVLGVAASILDTLQPVLRSSEPARSGPAIRAFAPHR